VIPRAGLVVHSSSGARIPLASSFVELLQCLDLAVGR
jgi:hypothetical protein